MTSRPPLGAASLDRALRGPHGPLRPQDTVDLVARTGSTSTDLMSGLVSAPLTVPGGEGTAPGWRVLVADHQEAGRGRAGRTWETPTGVALTFSLALSPAGPASAIGWVPLVAGLAVVRALRGLTGLHVGLKWPNDVLVDGIGDDEPGWGTARKVAGILAELVAAPGGPVVVLGIGINVLQTPAELPVRSATSLATALGAGGPDAAAQAPTPSRQDVLVAVLTALADLDTRWREAGGDVVRAGLAEDVAASCLTLGRAVRMDLPGGEEVRGRAVRLAPSGGLVLALPGGAERTVLAGDVSHLRVT